MVLMTNLNFLVIQEHVVSQNQEGMGCENVDVVALSFQAAPDMLHQREKDYQQVYAKKNKPPYAVATKGLMHKNQPTGYGLHTDFRSSTVILNVRNLNFL